MPQMLCAMNSIAGVAKPLVRPSHVTDKAFTPGMVLPGLQRRLPLLRREIRRSSSSTARGVGSLTISAKWNNRVDGDDTVSVSGRSATLTGLVATSIMITSLANVDVAHAFSKQDVTDAYGRGEEIVAQVAKTAGEAFSTGKGVLDKVYITVKPGLDAAIPFVQKSAETVTKVAAPIASDIVGGAKNALRSAGVNPDPGVEFAKSAAEQTSKAIQGAQPIGSSALDKFLKSEPVFIAEVAGGLVVLYLLSPFLLSTVVNTARGYAGDITAAQALDLLLTEDYSLIDIRTEKEKYRNGIPSLPGSAKNRYVALPIEEFGGRVKSQLRNSRRVEAEVAAIKIASLKKLNKGSKVTLLDENSGVAKTVAKALKKMGFKNIFVIVDGFNGGKGWQQSRLGTDNYTSSGPSFAEILSPSRIIPSGSGTKSSGGTTRGFKLLPGGSEE